jgi:hypothetical protein
LQQLLTIIILPIRLADEDAIYLIYTNINLPIENVLPI